MGDAEAIAEIAESFRRRVAELELATLRTRYELAQIMRHATETSGAAIFVQLGGHLHSGHLRLDATALRRIRRVASMIAPDEFEQLIGIRGPDGLPLTWCIMELLSTIRGRLRRQAVASELASRALTFKEAANLIRGTRSPASTRSRPIA